MPMGVLNSNYSASLAATGGSAPYTFVVSSGGLPQGVTLAPNGTIGGKPTQAGPFEFTVTATDSHGASGARAYQWSVLGVFLTIGPPTLPDATQGVSYSAQLTATGGTAPYTFTMPQAGLWDAGLTVQPNGIISGTPQSSGTTLNFTVAVSDANGSAGSRAFQLKVLSDSTSVLTITPAVLTPATLQQPYVATMAVSGGTAPYTFSGSASAPLPAGLVLVGCRCRLWNSDGRGREHLHRERPRFERSHRVQSRSISSRRHGTHPGTCDASSSDL
ncbi:MAG: Ig domain-containing protein [Acidobacteriota bacterium]